MDMLQWEQQVPEEIRQDPLWTNKAYRVALFASDVAWPDVITLVADRRTRSVGDQLLRAVGSISANISEGYSRSTGPDRARFYEYGLGSARESRDWYYKARHVLGTSTVKDRLSLLTNVVKMLMTTIPAERRRLSDVRRRKPLPRT